MKLAKAMRYGGELIDAADCDYSDFEILKPLCPCCSEPVHLRKGSDRISKLGKEFKIPKHWSHFNSTSEEQKAACEARVSSYTEADRQRIQSQARGQRLKLIKRWMWNCLSSGWTSYQNDLSGDSSQSFKAKGWTPPSKTNANIFVDSRLSNLETAANNPLISESIFKILKTNAHLENDLFLMGRGGNRNSIRVLEDAATQGKEPVISMRHTCNFAANDPILSCRLDDLCIADAQGHIKVCREVVEYLWAKGNKPLLCKLLTAFSARLVDFSSSDPGIWIAGVQNMPDQFGKSMATVDGMGIANLFRISEIRVVQLAYSIPWASEFARLEVEARQKVAA